MIRRCLRQARELLVRAAFLAVACKALIPIGYMPAALADGSPVMLCPAYGAWATQAMGSMLDEHGDADEQGSNPSPWQHCPLGALAAAAAFSSEFTFSLPDSTPAPVEPFDPTWFSIEGALGYSPRGPPTMTPAPS
jgi:hypothetical protein